jgi:hypothetical protein
LLILSDLLLRDGRCLGVDGTFALAICLEPFPASHDRQDQEDWSCHHRDLGHEAAKTTLSLVGLTLAPLKSDAGVEERSLPFVQGEVVSIAPLQCLSQPHTSVEEVVGTILLLPLAGRLDQPVVDEQ